MHDFSVCIPTYNRAELLRETLDHLLPFSKKGLEVVVSNNGSSDHTQDVINEYATKFKCFRTIEHKDTIPQNSNVTAALMLGTRNFLYILSDDDRILPDGLSVAIKMMKANDELVAVYGNYHEWDQNTNTIVNSSSFVTKPIVYTSSQMLDLLKTQNVLWLPVFKRKIAHRFCSFSSISWDNWTIISSLIAHGNIALIPDYLYLHARTPDRTELRLKEGWYHDMYRSDFEQFIGSLGNGNLDNAKFITHRTATAYTHASSMAVRQSDFLAAKSYILRARAYGLIDEKDIVSWQDENLHQVIAHALEERIKLSPFIEKIIFLATEPVLKIQVAFNQRDHGYLIEVAKELHESMIKENTHIVYDKVESRIKPELMLDPLFESFTEDLRSSYKIL